MVRATRHPWKPESPARGEIAPEAASPPGNLIATDDAGLRRARAGHATVWNHDPLAVRGVVWTRTCGTIYFRFPLDGKSHGPVAMFKAFDSFVDEPLKNYAGFTQP